MRQAHGNLSNIISNDKNKSEYFHSSLEFMKCFSNIYITHFKYLKTAGKQKMKMKQGTTYMA